MAEVIKMPKMSDTMTEGVIAAWHKQVGDTVKSGDILAEVETDKATMELENFEDGVLLYIGPKEGEAVPINAVIAIVGKSGEEFTHLIDGNAVATIVAANQPTADEPSATSALQSANKVEQAVPNTEDGRIKASPLARKIAEEKGINLAKLAGSGDGGRIVKRDVELHQETAPEIVLSSVQHTAPVVGMAYDEFAVSQMRKTIARRLAESKFSAPHFYLTIDLDMDKASETRTQLNAISPTKISFNDMLVKAAAVALKQHPAINSSWLGDKIRVNHTINIGVAMAVEEGLLVPVVRNADQKQLSSIAAEVKAYSQKAKDKKLQPADWEGNTFTISNLGMFGIESFTAIINPPDACIMAVGSIRQEPVVKNGQVMVGNRMKVTLSCDHRVVDGAKGAQFLQTFKQLVEDPIKMLV